MAQSYRELHSPPFDSETQYGREHKGYSPVPTDEYGQPPPYDSRPSSTGFRPAPYPAPAPSVQQQQTSNVVVVGSQPNPVQPVSVVQFQSVNDYLLMTVFLFLICLVLGNFPVMLCLFPALIFSCMASTYKDAGENELANRFGSLACKCNIAALIPAIFVVIAAVIAGVVIVLIVVGVF